MFVPMLIILQMLYLAVYDTFNVSHFCELRRGHSGSPDASMPPF